MKTSTLSYLTRCFFSFLIFVYLACSSSVFANTIVEGRASSNTPNILVNDSVPVAQITLGELRAIFTMKQRYWSDGTKITVFVLPEDHKTHRRFCKQRLSIFPRQLEKVWYRMVFTGTGQAPIEVESEHKLLERVANTPGAIGYIETLKNAKKTKILNIH